MNSRPCFVSYRYTKYASEEQNHKDIRIKKYIRRSIQNPRSRPKNQVHSVFSVNVMKTATPARLIVIYYTTALTHHHKQFRCFLALIQGCQKKSTQTEVKPRRKVELKILKEKIAQKLTTSGKPNSFLSSSSTLSLNFMNPT